MFYNFTKSFISFDLFKTLKKTPIQTSSPFSETYRQNYNKLWINNIKNYTP